MAFVDNQKIINQYQNVEDVQEVDGVFEVTVTGFPHNPLRIRVVETDLEDFPFQGSSEYEIKNSDQAGFYRSMQPKENRQGAVEDALYGFLTYYNPTRIEQTEFRIVENW